MPRSRDSKGDVIKKQTPKHAGGGVTEMELKTRGSMVLGKPGNILVAILTRQ